MGHITRSLLYCLILFACANFAVAQSDDTQIQSIDVQSFAIDAVAYNSDASRIATGSRDNVIRIYDTITGELLMDTEGHAGWITDLMFTPDDSQIISTSRDGTIRIFDADSGQMLSVIGRHQADVLSFALLPDENLLVSGSRNGVINIWDTTNSQRQQSIGTSREAVLDLAIYQNILAVARGDGSLEFWQFDGEQSGQIGLLQAHDDAIVSLEFSPDGSRLLTASIDRRARLWDMSDWSSLPGEPVASFVFDAALTSVRFAEQGTLAFVSSIDGTVYRVSFAQGIVSEWFLSGHPVTEIALAQNTGQVAVANHTGELSLLPASLPQIDSIAANPVDLFATNTPIPENPPASSTPILSAPSIDLDTAITTFPLGGGTWQIDPWETIVGHFEGTSWVNGTGNVVLGGHSEMPDGTQGIFASLYDVGIGDEITVQDGTRIRRYLVTNIKTVDYRDLRVVYPTMTSRLTLITCDIPSYIVEQGLYYERLVVIAEEVI